MLAASFKLPPSNLKLAAGEIHVWFAVLDQSASEFYRYIRTLSAEERVTARRFYFQEDRKRFVARHGILRMILGCYLGVKASELRFYHGENGKPAITETFSKEPICFNLSHSNGAALFAFTRNHEIGVDIEHIRDISEMEDIVERFFSTREKTFFRALAHEKRREAFFDCWTRKEALIKAIGEGLSCPLDKFDVTPVPDEGETLPTIEGDPKGVPDWPIHTLRLARDYAGALATESKSFTLRCFKWITTVAN
jgi:4'-phosphopantetheinyl transferase